MTALLVDLDDTLLDYSGGVDASWEAACRTVAGPAGVDVAALVRAIAGVRRWFWADPDRHRRERVDMLGAWTKIAAQGLAELGTPADGLASRIAEEFARGRRSAMRLFPDAPEALDAWRRRGLRLALVTNGDAREQRDKIARHRLGPFFDAILIESEFGTGKPDARIYRQALAALGVRPEEAWMVGDHLEYDVAGAQRAGLAAAWLDRPGRGLPVESAIRPDRIVRSLRDLADLGT